jgi:uncharacterized membrane protein YkoI
MKNLLRLLLAASALAAFVLASTSYAADKETKETPKGTIHPKGEVKPADLPSLAKVSFQQALAAALEKNPGSVISAELEVEDGCLMYSFRIVDAKKKITEVEIDAGNGKVLDTEDEEAEKEDKKK